LYKASFCFILLKKNSKVRTEQQQTALSFEFVIILFKESLYYTCGGISLEK